jgi:hypothetical protein
MLEYYRFLYHFTKTTLNNFNKKNKIKNQKNVIKEQIVKEKEKIDLIRISQNIQKEKVTNCYNKIKSLKDTLSNVS